jgi:hypothetical protein
MRSRVWPRTFINFADMSLLNLNIANRLRLGFGLLVVFIAVLAVVGWKSL